MTDRKYIAVPGRHQRVVVSGFNTLPDDKILDWSKLKQITDGILKCIYTEEQM